MGMRGFDLREYDGVAGLGEPEHMPPRGSVCLWRLTLSPAADLPSSASGGAAGVSSACPFGAAGETAAALSRLSACLTPAEQAHIARLRRRGDRRRGSVARGALRLVLGRLLGCAPEHVALWKTPAGRPYVSGRPELCLSVSHSGALVYLALGVGVALGVDVEQADPSKNCIALARRFFSPNEAAAVETADDPAALFFRLWTAREAFVKATGEGLARGLSSMAVDLAAGRVRDLRGPARTWHLLELTPPAGYAASLVMGEL